MIVLPIFRAATYVGDGEEQSAGIMGGETNHVRTMYGPSTVYPRYRAGRRLDDQTGGKQFYPVRNGMLLFMAPP